MNITGLSPEKMTDLKVLTVCMTWANHEAPKTPKYMSELIKQTEESVEVLKKTVAGVGQQLEEMKPLKAEFINELRAMRMNATREVADIVAPLQELRQFFLGKQHEAEVARLREFVELCERLQQLKQNGTLDAVADTIIKLA
jgi:hypothetical protein